MLKASRLFGRLAEKAQTVLILRQAEDRITSLTAERDALLEDSRRRSFTPAAGLSDADRRAMAALEVDKAMAESSMLSLQRQVARLQAELSARAPAPVDGAEAATAAILRQKVEQLASAPPRYHPAHQRRNENSSLPKIALPCAPSCLCVKIGAHASPVPLQEATVARLSAEAAEPERSIAAWKGQAAMAESRAAQVRAPSRAR